MTAHPPAHERREWFHRYLDAPKREKYRFRGWIILLLGIGSWLVVWALTSVLLASGAYAHEAPKSVSQPLGWLYPYACCSTIDCRPATEGEVRETPNGYLMSATGEVVPYTDKRVKDSPDGLFHTCQQGGNFDTGRVLCLFRPPRGM